MREDRSRYSTISIVLHWLIFVLIFANATVGGWMEDAEGLQKFEHFQLHKSLGLAILALSLFRFGWRLTHRWPAFPDRMATWERVLARGTHIAFYVLMIGAPLLGWAAVSAGGAPETPLFGMLPGPNLPIGQYEGLAGRLGDAHKTMVKAIYVLLALHVAGALKHHFIDRDDVLARMLPVLRRRSR